MPPTTQDRIESLYVDHHSWLHGWLRRQLGNSFGAAGGVGVGGRGMTLLGWNAAAVDSVIMSNTQKKRRHA